MKTEEIVKKAMSNRQAVSFKYRRITNGKEENINLARIIFMTTDNRGQESIAVDLLQEKRLTKMHYFDMNSISNIEILAV
jgi:hypothetical protein